MKKVNMWYALAPLLRVFVWAPFCFNQKSNGINYRKWITTKTWEIFWDPSWNQGLFDLNACWGRLSWFCFDIFLTFFILNVTKTLQSMLLTLCLFRHFHICVKLLKCYKVTMYSYEWHVLRIKGSCYT